MAFIAAANVRRVRSKAVPGNRLGRGFVSLAASAIAAVYIAGYVHTEAADTSLATPDITAPAAAAPPDSPPPLATLTSVVEATTLSAVAPPTRPAVITDQAVEDFANANHVSWDEARAQMEAAAGITHPPTADIPPAEASTTTPPPASRVAAAPTSGGRAVSTSTPRANPHVAAAPATPTAVLRAAPPSPTGTPAPKPAAAFTDGTFSGAGTSRRGDIQVSLTVQNGRVASVNITGATTQYPTRLIAGLPAQVVSRQSAQVDTVSGATFSSLAFRGAVQQALQRAQS